MAAYPPEDRVDHPEIQSPPTERLVPDTERTLPTSRNTVLLLSVVSVVLIIAGVAVAFSMDNPNVGLILTIVGGVCALLATWMAYGDARTGMATPLVATITAAVVSVVIALNTSAAERKLDEARDEIAPGVLGTPATVPADPAEIIDPEPSDTPTQ